MTIKIVHCKRVADHEYCGRGSPLGNPYVMENDSPQERAYVIMKYRTYLHDQVRKQNRYITNELHRIGELAIDGHVNLGCWCDPKPCHCKHIKQWIEDMYDVYEETEYDIIKT